MSIRVRLDHYFYFPQPKPPPPEPRGAIAWHLGREEPQEKPRMPMFDAITVNKRKRIKAIPLKDDETPGTADGPWTFTLESGEGSVEVVGDDVFYMNMGSNVDVVSVVLARVDADLGAGVRTIESTYTVTALAATDEATHVGFELGPEEPIP